MLEESDHTMDALSDVWDQMGVGGGDGAGAQQPL